MSFERRHSERRQSDRRKQQIRWPLADRRRTTVRINPDRRLTPPAERGAVRQPAHS
jgi:hypothetical protein